MKKHYSLFFLVVVLLTVPVFAQWTFDTDNESFETTTYNEKTTDYPFSTVIPSEWLPIHGNPDGHIYHEFDDRYDTEFVGSNRLYAILQNSANGIGDLTGKTVYADFWKNKIPFVCGAKGEYTPTAYWSIGDSQDPYWVNKEGNWWISKEPMVVDLNALPTDVWETKSIEMIRENFMEWPNSANDSKKFEELTADYKYIGITILSDKVSEKDLEWNTYVLIDGRLTLPHYGAYSRGGGLQFRLDNFRSDAAISVDFDIHPTSWPNPLNIKSGGVVPVAILGTESFDVTAIDIESLNINGVAPVMWSFEDVTQPAGTEGDCNDTEAGPDGFLDLTLKFDTKKLVSVLGEVKDGDELTLTIEGKLKEGQSLKGDDCVIIKGNLKKESSTSTIVDNPNEFSLLNNYPNPFNPNTTIRYGLDNDSHISVEIYDISGKLISTLIDTEQSQGLHSVIWNGTNQHGEQVPAGIYISKLTSGSNVKTMKLMLLK